MSRQQSIPKFSEDEQRIIDLAMRIESHKFQGGWCHRACLMWAKHVIAADDGKEAIVRERAGITDSDATE